MKINNSKLIKPENPVGFGSSTNSTQFRSGTFIMTTYPNKINNNSSSSIQKMTNDIYIADLSPNELNHILNQPWLEWIEPEQIFTSSKCEPWGLDRIDNTMDCQYSNTHFTGQNSHVYVIDTGMASNHQEYTNRIGEGINYVDNNPNDWEDCHGHGTHVAGTVGGTEYGVAKQTQIHPIRVLNCEGSGYTSNIIKSMQWIQSHTTNNGIQNAIISMSLGGGNSPSMDRMISQLVDNNMIVIVAAGNDNDNACLGSPANAKDAITVGATDKQDGRSYYSNYGDCVDIFAPGSDIKSAWIDGMTNTKTISGTSMATPHVSGVVALLLPIMKQNNITINQKSVLELLWDLSEKNKIKNTKTINNYFLNIPDIPPSPPPSPPSTPSPPPSPPPNNNLSIFEIIFIIFIVLLVLFFIIYCIANYTNNNNNNNNVIKQENIEMNLNKLNV